jgi:hypothetical protein
MRHAAGHADSHADEGRLIPRTVADVTPTWIRRVLGPGGSGDDRGDVDEVEIVEVIHGTATKVRIRVRAGGGDAGGRLMCLKAGLEPHAEAMAPTGIYANEARFFTEIRDRVSAPAPGWVWADFDPDSQLGAVLMEDLARPGVTFGRVTEPLGPDRVEAALHALAGFHAARLGADMSGEWPWLPLSVVEPGASASYFRTLGADVIASELGKPARGAAVPDELHDPRRVVEGFWAWVATNRQGPHCLLHGDAHVGNVYFDGDRAGFFDWQTVRRGRPTFDVAYLIGSALTTAERRAAERDLVASYRDRLAATGAEVPPLDRLWWDYRRDMTYGFFAWLTNLDVFQPEEVNAATIARFAQAVLDLESEAAVAATA